jgi:hypothetical protein
MLDFIIIGVQRGGTTSLYEYLIKHPDVIASSSKEIHFFDNHYEKGTKWYLEQFSFKKDKISGEATPYYIFHPLAPKRIHDLVPNVKLIVLLRNPVERAFSHYKLSVRTGNETLSFDDAIKAENTRLKNSKKEIMEGKYSSSHQQQSYLSRGIYIKQIKRYYELFPKDNILVLKSEDFFEFPNQTYMQVIKFLGLKNIEMPDFPVYNYGGEEKIDKDLRKKLVAYFMPHNKKLYDFLGIDFGWK